MGANNGATMKGRYRMTQTASCTVWTDKEASIASAVLGPETEAGEETLAYGG
jgi:hypothetical protein